ncbi:hypothetical protein KGS77_25895 [Streptomyces sp. MST-110588]|nr:hypothetical protein KGS77_25895 [Streptomyces sp. MST-110588]
MVPGSGARLGPWARWRRWRKGRPFWGGLAAIVAGAEICAIPLAPLKIMLQQGIAGIPSVLMGLVMILMGLAAWFAPHYRGLAGILTVMVAAAALVMSNLGGFLFGTVVGILGGGMIFAWQPRPVAGPDPVPPTGTRTDHAAALAPLSVPVPASTSTPMPTSAPAPAPAPAEGDTR